VHSRSDTEAVGTLESTLKNAETQHQVLKQKVDEAKDLVEQLAINNSPEQASSQFAVNSLIYISQ
jgi:phage shock protein A